MANIGVTEEESEKLRCSVDKPNVKSFSCFYISYAPTGRAKCYITGALIPQGALRLSFGILADYSNDAVATHGLAEVVLATLSGCL